MKNQIKKAVGIIILYKDKFILLSKRGKLEERLVGYWENVGGKVEEGEDWLEAVYREVAEELGRSSLDNIEIDEEAILNWVEKGKTKDDPSWNSRLYIAQAKSKFTPTVPDSEKGLVEKVEWFAFDELRDLKLAPYSLIDYRKLKRQGVSPFDEFPIR